jgi:hypothetical protein
MIEAENIVCRVLESIVSGVVRREDARTFRERFDFHSSNISVSTDLWIYRNWIGRARRAFALVGVRQRLSKGVELAKLEAHRGTSARRKRESDSDKVNV